MGPGADSTRPRRLMLGPGSVIAAIRCRQHEERIEGSLPAKARRQAADELFSGGLHAQNGARSGT